MTELYWLDTDIGGDIDDVFALIYMITQVESNQIAGISTCHLNPLLKAKIAKSILRELDINDIPVYSGYGTNGDREEFLNQNPRWPTQLFGIPQPKDHEKELYQNSGKAYHSIINDVTVDKGDPWDIIATISENNNLTIISIAPMFNISMFVQKYPHLCNKVRIIAMGGWFLNGNNISRLGYNTGINTKITDIVFNSGIEILLVNSQLFDNDNFLIPPEHFSCFEHTNKLGQMILQDWNNWTEEDTFQRKHIADPVTVFLALHPKYIGKTKKVSVQFNNVDPQIHLLHERANELITVREVESSNITVITDLKNPRGIYHLILFAILDKIEDN